MGKECCDRRRDHHDGILHQETLGSTLKTVQARECIAKSWTGSVNRKLRGGNIRDEGGILVNLTQQDSC